MASRKFEFRRIRDFGQVFGDTYVFLRSESKPFIRSYLAICGVFMLLSAVLGGMLQSEYFSKLTNESLLTQSFAVRSHGYLSVTYFLTMFSSLIAYMSMQVAVFSYIKLYVDNNNTSPSIDQVWKLFVRKFLSIFFFGFVISLLQLIGCIFCLVPGIYLWVVLAPLSMIMIFEEMSFTEAFNRCFFLIKENFWSSFSIYLIAIIIYYFISAISGGVISGIAALVTYLTTKNISSSFGVLSSFLNVFALCFYLIPLMSIALNYFSLVERKDGTGIMRRIESIGQQNTQTEASEEDY